MPDRQQIKMGRIQGEMDYLRYMENIEIREISAAAEIKRLLLEQKKYVIDLRQAENYLTMSHTEVNILLNELEHAIHRLNLLRKDLQNIWYKDPSFAVEAAYTKREVENKLENAIAKCYKTAQVLEYEWVEEYKNPITIPLEPPYYIEGHDYDHFTDSFSIFSAQRAYDCGDFLDALWYWDSKLREIGVRGPNGQFTPRWISIRDDILGFEEFEYESSIRLFKEYIKDNIFVKRMEGEDYDVLKIDFATTIEDCTLFPGCSGAYKEHWNQRIEKGIACTILADAGFTEDYDTVPITLVQSGTITLHRFWKLISDEDFFWNYNTERSYNYSGMPDEEDLEEFIRMRISQSVFSCDFLAKVNKQETYEWYIQNPHFYLCNDLEGRSISVSNWMFIIDTSNPDNQKIDLEKIKDIRLLFFYTYGNPRNFGWQ